MHGVSYIETNRCSCIDFKQSSVSGEDVCQVSVIYLTVIAGCPYGDKLGWCNTLGFDRPAADCYAYNETCCQTCHLYDSGIPGE